MSKIINVDIKKFSYSKETILKDITFSINKGEFIVITDEFIKAVKRIDSGII